MFPYDERKKFGAFPNSLWIEGKKHYEFAAKHVTNKVLDVGCGFGALAEYLPGVTYKGIDNTEWVANAAAEKGLNVVFGNVMTSNLTKSDYVCAFGVLETAEDLSAMAAKLKSLAKNSVLFSFSSQGDDTFKAYTQEQIIAAFGDCSFEAANQFITLGKCDV